MRPDPARLAAQAQAALSRADWPAAVEALRGLIALAPKPPGGLVHNLALALKHAGRPKEALAEFDRALKLEPGHLKAIYERAALLMETNRPAEALAGFEAYLKADPQDSDARRNRARLLLALGRWPEAEAAFAAFSDEEGELAQLRLAAEQGRAEEAATRARALMARPEARAAVLKTLTASGRGSLPLKVARLLSDQNRPGS
ncbi:tetratricopeptide repeat protein [Neomegalonema sp.]|uniref:tetratricopeptide repeat protein n=1 Tax=Neomegalonema sp. TaxID=2039713 RepID=UPI002629F31B|nr:tetratricopeptide repeat protein [Neomegalonema sp.]MDD2868198.1 tetratricopeptide repeat protein [Neomegalonema sp.]